MNIFNPTIFPAVTALIGSLIGAGITACSGLYMERRRHRRNVEIYTAGFIAEVESLVEIINIRGYITDLESTLQTLPKDQSISFNILIPDNYARFYDANIAYVGLLKPTTAKNLVIFHQILQAIVQDFKPESFCSANGHSYDTLKELLNLANKAIQLADEIKLNK
ncbi:hypothetical protein ACNARK_05165 [Proteus sp. DFP240708]|uniref:Uncharacterized protein n=1 Tax=Proteus mirabilis TaxID=584 RepID=A0A2X2BHE4_PROMI|nr:MULTISPECIES: hypothetical protein [Proteus]AYY80254.1 hypothetical protein EGX81_04955 [Proteus vulgaris]KAB7716221.1 hypothetical protein GBN12_06300 [Proteus mirabilis]MBG2900367.1 hypothetical protein [Proteus mirabilis]MBG3037256.1 hypothetical protein [Proteus mirabilis]MBI6414541.1 hypothetical protein [Proteus mirabilis]